MNVFSGRFCSRWPPHILLFSWRVICCKYLQVWKSFLDLFVSPSLVCLNYPCYFCFTKFGVLGLSRDDFTKFGVLEFFWNCQNHLFSWIVSAQISVLVIFVFRLGSKLPCLFPFLFYFIVPFCFLWSPCHLFSYFVWSNPIHWHLKLLARDLVSDVCFLSI